MKTVFCAYDDLDCVGGPNTWLRRLLPELQKAGVAVHALLLTPCPGRGATSVALRSTGIPCTEFAFRTCPFTQQRLQRILSFVVHLKPDIFVPNLVIPAYYLNSWFRQAGIATVGVMHSDDPFYWALIEEFVNGPLGHRLSGLVCVSEYLRSVVVRLAPKDIKIAKIPCGAPVPNCHNSEPTNGLRLVYVGRLEQEQKRILDLTRSFCRAAREIPGTEAVIYGEGRARAEVEWLLATEGKGLPVSLQGRIDSDEIQDHLLQAHAIVLLSDYEGLPISLIEGMACGLVPICTNMRSGIPELVEHGVTGLVVSDRGNSFIRAVETLRTDTNLWRALSHGARARVQTEYASEACARQWIAFLSDLVPEPRRTELAQLPRIIKLPPVRPEFSHQDLRPRPITRRGLLRLLELYLPSTVIRLYKRFRISHVKHFRRPSGEMRYF